MDKKNAADDVQTLYKEVLRSDWDKAQATIEQQAREIERLSNYIEQQDDAYSLLSFDAGRKIDELEQGLAALRAQQPGVVLPEPMNRGDEGGSVEYGAAMIRGFNACLREVKRLNSSLVSASGVDERHVTVKVEMLELMRNFTVQNDSGVAGILRGNIDAILLSRPAKQATDGGRNPFYEGLFDDETEEQRHSRLLQASAALTASAQSVPNSSAQHQLGVYQGLELAHDLLTAAGADRSALRAVENGLRNNRPAAPAPGKGGAE